ncbi:MAG: winged helix-turn-helix domain-containing protein [Dokdonella sp.]|uniref:winged helix-turn-helix domain-containing protein n=1 Tax=Dokdonella sp. TaxID=2291710 RepID=UPI0025BA99AE|nr:winged helix-turn-helix domain-containing protein [Dokdonella sp.]MBX3700344.1 winged helix-turn-helix domain-containing protein [Dokdonella sp.]
MQYRFDTFLVDPAARLLQRQAVPLNVSRKVFDCLTYLIEHRERAIGRDELARALWKHDSVSDNQLAQVVAAVRRLVDDDGSLQRLVRTVPGFGYHWVGHVDAIDANVVDPGAPIAEHATTPPEPDPAAVAPAPATTEAPSSLPAAVPVPVAVPPSVPQPAVPAPGFAAGRRAGASLLLLALLLLLLVGVWRRAPVEEVAPATPATDVAHSSQVWVLPAALPDESESWARVGLMALVGEGLRRTGATVAPVDKVLARIREPVASDRVEPLRAELDATIVIQPRVHRLGDNWVVELDAASKSLGSARVDANASELTAAARVAVTRLTQRLQLSGAALDGSNEEAFGIIEQSLRARDFEGALLQLSRLPAQAREMPEAGILEIDLDLDQGRYRAARDKAEHWLERLDRTTRPVAFARALLRKAAAMRQLSEPDWPPLVDEALELLNKANSPRDLAMATQFRGIAAIVAGRQADAARDLARAREMFLALGDELRAARVASTMAQQAELQGRYMEAMTLLEQSSRVLRAYNAVASQLVNANWTAFILIEQARWDDVLHVSDEMRPLLQTGGGASNYEQFTYLRVRTWALMELGRLQEAEALLNEQERVIQREISDNRPSDGSRVELIEMANQRARLRIMQGRWEEARAAATQGLELFAKVEDDGSFTYRQDGETLLSLLVRAQAGEAPWSPQAPLPRLTPKQIEVLKAAVSENGLLARAYWNARRGNTDAADADYRAALALDRAQRSPNVMLDIVADYVQFLLSRGRVADASQQIDLLEAHAAGVVDRDYDAALTVLRVRLAEGNEERARLAARRVRELIGERQAPADLRAILGPLATAPATTSR